MSVAENRYYDLLTRVVTVRTVCDLWGVSKTVVYHHIMQDHIAAAQCGSTWLIALDSVVDLWGKPLNLTPGEPHLPLNSPKRL